MDTFVNVCGMTSAVLALVFMAVVGIASAFINKKDLKKLNEESSSKPLG